MGYKNICLTNYFIYHKGSVSIKSVSGFTRVFNEQEQSGICEKKYREVDISLSNFIIPVC